MFLNLLFALLLVVGGYPDRIDPQINDYARVLTADTTASLRTLLTDLERETGVEAVVVVIPSTADYPTGDSTFEAFATGLFNTWGIGDAARDDGILLLVALEQRKVRIEVGAGYGSTLNAPMQTVISEYILPEFRRDNYNRGIYNGLRGIIQALTGEWPSEDGLTPPPASPIEIDPMVVGLGAVGLAGGALFARRTWRFRQRKCECGGLMYHTPNTYSYLNDEQRREEKLKLATYDVWVCVRCEKTKVYRHRNRLNFAGKCPECGQRTVTTRVDVMQPATTTSTGLKQVTKSCSNCSYNHTYTAVIAVLSSSSDNDSDSSSGSSSGSSSSGGGSSDGGGASGDW